MRYYRAFIKYNSNKKKKQLERTIFVQTPEKYTPMTSVLNIIRKIPFGRLIYAKEISREEYVAGVSRVNG